MDTLDFWTAAWTAAWAAALPIWQAAVLHSGWHPATAAAAYAAAALLCLAAAREARNAGETAAPWTTLGVALLLLSMNALYAFDLLWVEWMRALARAAGWYEQRRFVQVLALCAAGAAALAGAAAWSRSRRQRAGIAALPCGLLAGLALLAGLHTLRLVSLHATDTLINARLFGLSVGRLAEALGLGMVAAAAWRHLLRGHRGLQERRAERHV